MSRADRTAFVDGIAATFAANLASVVAEAAELRQQAAEALASADATEAEQRHAAALFGAAPAAPIALLRAAIADRLRAAREHHRRTAGAATLAELRAAELRTALEQVQAARATIETASV